MGVKQQRMNERIREILSQLVQREVADPRLQHVTITEVSVDPEMVYATVYVNALGDESRQAEVMDGLRRAAGFLRRETGKRIRLRSTPELLFRWDTTLERGEHINRLLDELDIPPPDPDDRNDEEEDDLD
jgi:ribosome-binding factor A